MVPDRRERVASPYKTPASFGAELPMFARFLSERVKRFESFELITYYADKACPDIGAELCDVVCRGCSLPFAGRPTKPAPEPATDAPIHRASYS
jgi:hypothetical protein